MLTERKKLRRKQRNRRDSNKDLSFIHSLVQDDDEDRQRLTREKQRVDGCIVDRRRRRQVALIGPGWERAEVEVSVCPRVDAQLQDQHADDVHHNAGSYLFVPQGQDNSIGSDPVKLTQPTQHASR